MPINIYREGYPCKDCEGKLLPISGPTCLRCGKKLDDEDKEYCFLCSGRKNHFDKGYALYVYEDIAKRLVLQLKYEGRRDLALFFGREVVEKFGSKIKSFSPDCLIPVPISKERFVDRGYNQAEIVAREIGRRLDIPVLSNIVIREKATKAMKTLTINERIRNLIDAFRLNTELYGHYFKARMIKRVVIIDDIYTTGATMEVISAHLKLAGVNEIYFIALTVTSEV